MQSQNSNNSSGSSKGQVKSRSASSGSVTMADLLASYKSSFKTLHKGETVKGKITKLTPKEILVDVEAKTEAVVLEKDKRILRNLLSTYKVGDMVDVYILDPESDKGNPVISMRKSIDELSWKRLEDQKQKRQEIEVTINEVTKGGYLVSTKEGMSGFLPNSHLSFSHAEDIVGKKIKAFLLELNRPEKKIIFSQKPVMGVDDFEKAIKGLKVEQKIDATVSNITPFGVFVILQNVGQNVDGLVHISEISWEKIENVSDHFTMGQKVEAAIIGFDKDAKRVDLSVKRLSTDPFEEIFKSFTVDQKVTGKVLRISSNGVSLRLSLKGELEVEGFIRKEKIPPTITYNVGDEVIATVSQIDKRKHRILLVPVLSAKPIGYR